MRLGAYDFMPKPWRNAELLEVAAARSLRASGSFSRTAALAASVR